MCTRSPLSRRAALALALALATGGSAVAADAAAPVPGTPAGASGKAAAAPPVAGTPAAQPGAKKPAGATAAPAKSAAVIRIEYVAPTNPAHEPIYRQLRDARALEDLAKALRFIRLPRPLTLRLSTCGEANAWYDPDDQSATFCYDMLADFVKNAPGARERGIAQEEAVRGPFAFFYMHEIGHAMFHLLKVPVLGREEDAADQFAGFVILLMGPEVATGILRGTAWTFAHDASSRQADTSDYADAHGLDAQRYYNVLCLAYGSDPEVYAAATTKAGLPKERAEGCKDEWLQTRYAISTLMAKHADRAAFAAVQKELVQKARARRAKQAGATGQAKPVNQAGPSRPAPAP